MITIKHTRGPHEIEAEGLDVAGPQGWRALRDAALAAAKAQGVRGVEIRPAGGRVIVHATGGEWGEGALDKLRAELVKRPGFAGREIVKGEDKGKAFADERRGRGTD
jgi:hypothetical protein